MVFLWTSIKSIKYATLLLDRFYEKLANISDRILTGILQVHLVTPATPQFGLLLFSAIISSRYLAAFLSSSLDRFDKDLVIRKEFFDLSPTRIQEKRQNLISRFAGIMEAAYMNHRILGLLSNSRNTVTQGTSVPTVQRRPDGILKYNQAGGAESANQVQKKNKVAFPPGVKLE